jgi:hypothetical protein
MILNVKYYNITPILYLNTCAFIMPLVMIIPLCYVHNTKLTQNYEIFYHSNTLHYTEKSI